VCSRRVLGKAVEMQRRGETHQVIISDYAGQPITRPLLDFYVKDMSTVFIVFNLVDMQRGVAAERKCLQELLGWFNLVIAHTYDEQAHKMASIVLVGTHLDVVMRDAATTGASVDAFLERVSHRFYEEFNASYAWPFLIPNEHGRNASGARTQLHFFSVDSTRGREDRGLRLLMQLVESLVISALCGPCRYHITSHPHISSHFIT